MSSSFEFGPILRALARNKIGAILIALQIAVTMTIVVNAIFIIQERSELMARDSGINEKDTFYLNSNGFASDFNHKNTIQEDLLALRNLPGVANAITINAIPTSGSGWSMSLQTEPGENKDDHSTAVYMMDEQGLDTLQIELIAGRNFNANETRWRDVNVSGWPDVLILSKAMANSMFPDLDYAETIGKTVYINYNEPMQIIGIVERLQAPWVNWSSVENSMLVPDYLMFDNWSRYFVRTEPGARDEVMVQVEELLANRIHGRIVEDFETFEQTRADGYSRHAAMIKILTTVMIVLTLVTGLGIVGLASFSVNRRKKQIGTRRALGASQTAIVRYFMVENFMITGVGVIIGAALTMGLNILLVNMFELGRIDWYYIPLGMVTLWIVGQLAVFGPAKKAAGIPPAMATRTV